jgi:hypothetical protein
MEGEMMDFRFEVSLEGHGVDDVVEMDAMKLLESLEENFPGSVRL